MVTTNFFNISTEQFTTSLIDQTNNTRTFLLNRDLSKIQTDYNNANKMLEDGVNSINKIIQSNRGGNTGMHGFIGEHAQVLLTNSMFLAQGDKAHYSLIDDNGPVDYMYDNIMIQQKACRSGGYLGLDRIEAHANRYPFYVTSGGIYQIPKDSYITYTNLSNIPKETANKFLKPDYNLWKYVNNFNKKNPDIIIKPMNFNYDEIQVNTINKTIQQVKETNKTVYVSRREDAYQIHRPSVEECFKISVFSALTEGAFESSHCIYNKLTQKPLSEFNRFDVLDISLSNVKGVGKGALKSSAVYFITNSTNISAPVASATITAASRLTKETKDVVTGKITPQEYTKKTSWICVDAAVTVFATKIGSKYLQKILPGKLKGLSFVGPLIGNLVIIPIYNKTKTSIIRKTRNMEDCTNEQC